jgi:hypothetical protein
LLLTQLIVLKLNAQLNMMLVRKIQNAFQLLITVKRNVDQVKLVGHSVFRDKEVKPLSILLNVLQLMDV